MSVQVYRLSLIGPFRLEAPSGGPVEIKSKKSRAILAALATGRDLTRSKAWLQDHLWSDRADQQAKQSFRVALTGLRRVLGPDQNLLIVGKDMLSLDPACIWIDVGDEVHLTRATDTPGEALPFLADLAIPDPQFERWVKDRRAHYARRLTAAPTPPTQPLHRPIIIRARSDSDGAAQRYDTILQGLICKSIDDTGKVQLVDEGAMSGLSRGDAERAFRVEVNSVDIPGMKSVSVNLTRSLDGTVFTNLVRLSETVDMIDLVNEAVEQSLDEIAGYEAQLPVAKIATAMCFRAMKSITDYAPTTIEAADRLIAKAYEIDPQPVFLAWRAYLRTFLLGESGGGNSQAISQEMERFISLAEEQEPGNSIILSLAAFIRSMWLLSNEEALELAQRSHQINPSNPYGISYLGMVHTHLGNFEEGYRLTRRANALTVSRSAKSSIRYVAMRSAACAGRYTEAIKIGEALDRDAPHFVAPKRLMGMLYMKCGRVADAEATVEALRVHEHDYSMEKMRDAFRASPLLHRSKLGKAG